MKIRTRLLLSLLPALVGGIILISILLCYSWRSEISNGYQERLRTALITTAALLKSNSAIDEELRQLWDPFGAYRLMQVDRDGTIHTFLAKGSITHAPHHLKNPDVQIVKENDGRWMIASFPLASTTLLAEVQASSIDRIFIEHIRLAAIGVGLLALITMGSLYLIAGKISEPVQKLNNSALAIAAGQYGESIQVQGPKEIQELANTLNTMSECLLENINRLKENSLLRERIYGESECARLLQHLMLQKNIDECSSDAIAVKALSFCSAQARGLLLDFPASEGPEIVNIHLAEAKEEGFEGMYQLLTHYKLAKVVRKELIPFPSLRLVLDRKKGILSAKGVACAPPHVWSMATGSLQELKGERMVEAGDFIFLMNQGLWSFFKGPSKISEIFSKVLKHFAEDGLETNASMLQKEIAFATKRKDLEEDLHLICIHILKPLL